MDLKQGLFVVKDGQMVYFVFYYGLAVKVKIKKTQIIFNDGSDNLIFWHSDTTNQMPNLPISAVSYCIDFPIGHYVEIDGDIDGVYSSIEKARKENPGPYPDRHRAHKKLESFLKRRLMFILNDIDKVKLAIPYFENSKIYKL